ncbi:FAD-binding oxidoreductase [Aestuariicoccus sp. MJ-SS9]|uniref:NAD(P)/FAD-dependent oxidoreductase n=1 Tax=Aestuariicoccus sp. MJ-SS9 TaxID=3079855 RepID=UPI002911D8B4|nr:FAD-binding oxidoreductase [Aestuariicoccus sp. MJ-SS9]MDU8909795.1 FAD-binding oxidoreductase [Aestuariicoccus sp. MJ-SS9]
MRGIRPPVDPGPAGWARLLPDPDPPTPLERAATADWLVIGAGFAGLAAARRLSQLCPGDRIAVLEAHRVADGPAGRNSGFMIDLPHDLASENYAGAVEADLAQIADNRHAIAFAARMAEAFDIGPEGFARTGKINAAATAKGARHNADFARHLAALGEPCERLDAADMHTLTGTRFYREGLFTPGTAMIQPALFVRGVARGLRSNRIAIHELSPVTALERKGDWVATTPRGSVTAPRVILAVNGHLERFGHMRGRLMHVFTYASMTRALTADETKHLGGAPVWGLTPADPLGTTVRRISGTGGDRIVVRNRFTYEPGLEVSDARLARICRAHDRSFAARFPMLAGVGMEYRWGGRLCLSRNNVQVIGALEPGLWSACCQNGLGTAKGTLAGLLAAEAAAGVGSPALSRALAAAPPARLPPRPLIRAGAAARLRWGEWTAGREL